MTQECCRKVYRAWPSGRTLTHSRDCPVSPNQKVRHDRVPAPVPTGRKPSSPGAGVGTSAIGGETSLKIWFSYPSGCNCIDCGYIETYLDSGEDADVT
jgi:hypothetical protein